MLFAIYGSTGLLPSKFFWMVNFEADIRGACLAKFEQSDIGKRPGLERAQPSPMCFRLTACVALNILWEEDK
jgi:hypothetical protein